MTPHTRCGWSWLITHAGDWGSSFSFEVLLPCVAHNFFFTSVIMFSFFPLLLWSLPAFRISLCILSIFVVSFWISDSKWFPYLDMPVCCFLPWGLVLVGGFPQSIAVTFCFLSLWISLFCGSCVWCCVLSRIPSLLVPLCQYRTAPLLQWFLFVLF